MKAAAAGSPRLDIAIVGCGTAGQTAALALARMGHAVTLFERFAEPRPLGAGLLLQPTGLAVLARLGLLEPALALGQRIARLHGRTVRGRTVIDLRYRDHAPAAFGLGMHRGALFSLLLTALEAEPVRLAFDHEIAAIESPERPVLRDRRDVRHGPFDLAIVAEGARSPLRAQLFPEARAPLYPWGALWTICPDTDGQFGDTLEQTYDTARIMIGVLPVGRLPGADDDARLVSFFWSLKLDGVNRWREAGLARWREGIADRWPALAPLLARIDDPDALTLADYRDVRLSTPWRERVVFIGDAAHGTSPQLGQGANLAMIDALLIARHVAALPHRLDAALARYAAARRGHVSYYRWASRVLTPVFQSDSRLLAALRDLVLGPLCRAPLLRGAMIATLTGEGTHLWGRLRADELYPLGSKSP